MKPITKPIKIFPFILMSFKCSRKHLFGLLDLHPDGDGDLHVARTDDVELRGDEAVAVEVADAVA